MTLPISAAAFMPHDAPMALIDDILTCDAQHITTRVRLHKNSLFVDAHHRVNVTVGIEYMAQSAAAWAGYNARNNQIKPPIGMLLGTRHYQAEVPYFAVGDELTISAECLMHSTEGMGSFDCTITRNDQVIARARLSVYQPKS